MFLANIAQATPIEAIAQPQTLEPEPLRAPITQAEPYPVDALGTVLAGAAMALQDTVKAPMALCCQSLLASAALAAQAHFDVVMPWGAAKPLSLYFLTVASSGERKTTVDDLVLAAAYAQQKDDMAAYSHELAAYELDLEIWKTSMVGKNPKGQAGRDQAAADRHEAKHSKPAPPIQPLRFATDPTIEGLYGLLARGQPSVGLFSSEGGLLIGGHAMNRDNALKTMARFGLFWDGKEFDRVRAGDGSGILYGRRLALHLMAQPDVMGQLLNDPIANGQGFLARCLVAYPETTIGTRLITAFENPNDRHEFKRLFAVLKQLMEAEPRTGNNLQELDPVPLHLTENAKVLALNATNQFEDLMKTGAKLCELTDRTSKAMENAYRLAAVLAVIDNGLATSEISVQHLKNAIILMQWYLQEALRLRGEVVIPQKTKDAETLSKWLASRGLSQFCTTSINTICPNQLRDAKRLNAAISVLVEHGYLSENDKGTVIDGKKPRNSWRVLHHVV